MPKYANTNSLLTVIILRNNTRFYVAIEGIVFSLPKSVIENAILKHLKVTAYLALPAQLDNVV